MLAAIELCHQILDFLRILKHFSDPKSVKIWANYEWRTDWSLHIVVSCCRQNNRCELVGEQLINGKNKVISDDFLSISKKNTIGGSAAPWSPPTRSSRSRPRRPRRTHVAKGERFRNHCGNGERMTRKHRKEGRICNYN